MDKKKSGDDVLLLVLLERLGLILILAYFLVSTRYFRSMIMQRTKQHQWILIFVFGLLVIIANLTGVEITSDHQIILSPLITGLSSAESLANTRMVVIASSAIVGGPFVGSATGFIGGMHRFLQGNFSDAFYIVSSTLAGAIIGILADRFYQKQHVIKSGQIICLGALSELIQLTFVYLFSGFQIIKIIFLPMLLLTMIGVEMFIMIIQSYLANETHLRAVQTKDVLELAEKTLPYFRKGLSVESAQEICHIIKQYTHFDAVGLTNCTTVLGHVGAGCDHHIAGEAVQTDLSKNVISTGQEKVVHSHDDIGCPHIGCPLSSAIVLPLEINHQTVGALKLYLVDGKTLQPVDIRLAEGLCRIFNGQLAEGIAEQQEALAKSAEIRALQAQMNPHFFFNAINTISALMRIDMDRAHQALMYLSTYFRGTLQTTQQNEILLLEELKIVQAYVNMEQLRFPNKFQIQYDIAEEALREKIPPFSLQIPIENAIKHAFKHRKKENVIDVCVEVTTHRILIEIRDNGIGMNDNQCAQLGKSVIEDTAGSGTALYNLNQRLINLYGEKAQFHIFSEEGTTVQINIPRKEEVN